MLMGLWAAAALAEAEVEAEGALLLLLLQAASASPAAMTALRRRHRRVAGVDGTAKLLCALSQGCGLAVVPVGRVAARLTGFFMYAGSAAHPRPAGAGGCCLHMNLRSETEHSAPKGSARRGLLSVKRSHELDRKRVCFSGGCQEPTSAACSNETYRRCPPCGHRSQVPVGLVGLASYGIRRRRAKMAGRAVGPQCHMAVR